MKLTRTRPPIAHLFLASVLLLSAFPTAAVEPANQEKVREQFVLLCDLASATVTAETNKWPFFVDSYAVRALCAAYDLTGKDAYLDACKTWSRRMAAFQDQMHPAGAYYMNYNRKPGQDKGDWYVADSSSIGVGVLATAVRCKGAERQRYLDSAMTFAALVLDNYIGKGGGIRNGLWSKFDGEWWCSSGIFGSLAFLLYDETGDRRYLNAGLGALEWLDHQDLAKDETARDYSLSKMGPTKPMYVLEAYSAGWAHLKPGSPSQRAALEQMNRALKWIAEQQAKPLSARDWQPDRGWGMKFGGLPFHQYVYARLVPGKQGLAAAADLELEQLAGVMFAKPPVFTQLTAFIMMSYAERLAPGAIYRNDRGAAPTAPARDTK
jgi:hypothetical protein